MFQLITQFIGRRERERAEYRDRIAALVAQGKSQEEAYAVLHLEDAAWEAVFELKDGKRRAHRITKMALGISLPHQIGYFVSVARPEFAPDWLQWAHPVSIITGAVLGPILVDTTIIFFVKHLTLKVASLLSKLLALLFMIIPCGASAYINFAVPAPHWILNWLFGGAVVMIPLVHGYRAFFKTNFRPLVKDRVETLKQVTTKILGGRKCLEGCTCRKHEPRTGVTRKRTGRKRGSTGSTGSTGRKRKGTVPANAPVSPLWVIEGRMPTAAEFASLRTASA